MGAFTLQIVVATDNRISMTSCLYPCDGANMFGHLADFARMCLGELKSKEEESLSGDMSFAPKK